MRVVLYGNAYSSLDLIGRIVELIPEGQKARIIAVSHYGFMVDGLAAMINWYNENETWRWIEAPEGHR